jgi:small ligand-binding sensory domain FIST
MSAFASALVVDPDWKNGVTSVLAELGELGNADLGFVYIADPLSAHAEAIVASLRERTKVAHWIGSIGLGVSGRGRVEFDTPALSVMVGSFGSECFRVFDSAKLDDATSRWAATTEARFAVVHGDPHVTHLPDEIVRFSAALDGGFLVGGLSSSRQACPQIANSAVSGGLSGALFSGGVGVATQLSQGCSPISGSHRVTRGDGNLIAELDGRPALEVMKEAIGELLAKDLRRAAGYIFVAFTVPGSDTAEYMVRNLVAVDTRSGIIAVGEHVKVGDTIVFCKRDASSAIEDMQRMLDKVKLMLGTRTARGGLYYSCLARGPNQFSPDDLELRMIQESLGDIPMAGFFANGEISHDRLYGYTGVLAVFM